MFPIGLLVAGRKGLTAIGKRIKRDVGIENGDLMNLLIIVIDLLEKTHLYLNARITCYR